MGTEYPIAKQIEHLARDVLAISDSLTPMAVDYIFYHHFLDADLQGELRRLRRRRLGTDEPMAHLRLGETAAVLQQARKKFEDADREMEQRAKRTAEDETMELESALREARRRATPEALERVAQLFRRSPKPQRSRDEKRLDELARWIPADRLSLTFVLLYGTPVLPPGLVP